MRPLWHRSARAIYPPPQRQRGLTRFKEKQTAPSLCPLLSLLLPPASPDASPPPRTRSTSLYPFANVAVLLPAAWCAFARCLARTPVPPISVRRGEGSRRRESGGVGGGVTQYSSGTFSTGRPLRCSGQKRREETHSLRACSSLTRYARVCFSPSAVHLSPRSENRTRDLGKTGG